LATDGGAQGVACGRDGACRARGGRRHGRREALGSEAGGSTRVVAERQEGAAMVGGCCGRACSSACWGDGVPDDEVADETWSGASSRWRRRRCGRRGCPGGLGDGDGQRKAEASWVRAQRGRGGANDVLQRAARAAEVQSAWEKLCYEQRQNESGGGRREKRGARVGFGLGYGGIL
jgi:hypothetical protein